MNLLDNLVRYRYRWFLLSAVLIVPGLYFLLLHPLITTGQFRLGVQVGIDFSGGSIWELELLEAERDEVSTAAITSIFAENGFEGAQVQISANQDAEADTLMVLVRSRALDPTNLAGERDQMLDALAAEYGPIEQNRLESVGPTISQESTFWAIIAVVGASVVILIYLTFAFRNAPNPIRYGACAIISMVHDVLLILGVAAIAGTFFGLEVDALFLTAMLTILSFSVHDTIVVFDRVRENLANQRGNETFAEIVNHSLVQTLPRSINTQLTTMFTLTALLLFGGSTIRDFIFILLIGLISGTYSSIFNAAQILVIWHYQEWQQWFGGSSQPSAASS
jgi:preprotein translocase subunit SecF